LELKWRQWHFRCLSAMWRVTSRSTGIKMAKFGLVQAKIKCNPFVICKKTLAKSEIHAESLEQKKKDLQKSLKYLQIKKSMATIFKYHNFFTH
jgi:hypothetical protein